MVSPKVQVTGICRWSYPSSQGDFRLTPEDLQDANRMLYAPARMEHRLYLLEEVVLPALRQQTDPDFTLVVLLGENLPDPYRTRVLKALATVPQVRIVFEAEGQAQQGLIRRLLIALRDPDAEAVAEFRLDDDDAIAVDFVAETRRIFEDIRPLYRGKGLFAVDFTRGLTMSTTAEACEFEPIKARWWAPGMVVFIRPDISRSVLDFHHMRLWHRMHTLMHSDKPMFIRGVHHANDSSIDPLGRRSGTFRLDRDEKKKLLWERFAIDAGRVRRIWRRRGAEFMAKEN